MDNPDNYPVLIHCFAGIHRTGAFCAIYRMEYEGWTNAEAIEELRACGYSNLDDEWDILGYLEQYRRSRAPRAVGTEDPGCHAFAAELATTGSRQILPRKHTAP